MTSGFLQTKEKAGLHSTERMAERELGNRHSFVVFTWRFRAYVR